MPKARPPWGGAREGRVTQGIEGEGRREGYRSVGE